MSKIQAVNYQQQPKLAQPHANHASAQSFGHGLSDLPKGAQKILVDGVGARIDKRTGLAGKFFTALADRKGEIQTQSINAIFTGTLAYYMIAHNPFFHKDEKEKKYTAWRQPISAVIAIGTVLPITIGLNKFMDNLYHKGHFETIDLRLEPSKDHLKSAYKKHCKAIGETRTAAGLKDYMERVKEERLGVFTKLLSEDPKNITVDEASKAILINGKDIQEGHLLRVPGFETKEALDKYLEKNSLHNKTFRQFLTERFGFESFSNGELKPHITEAKLTDIKAIDFLKEMGLVDEKATETGVRKALSKIYEKKKIGENVEGFAHSNMKLSEKTSAKQLEINGKLTARTIQLYLGEKLGKAKVTTMGQLLHPLELLELDYLNESTKASMNDTLKMFKDLFDETGLEGIKEKADLSDFAKNILKNSAKRMSEYATNYKNYTNIGVNLITTAISCTILNWAYPRVMERFFPELVKSDNKPEALKGGNK